MFCKYSCPGLDKHHLLKKPWRHNAMSLLAAVLLALPLLVFMPAAAQAADTGTISGAINVNGASISATNSASGASYITQSAGGAYSLPNLPVGTYSVQAVAVGYDFIQGSGYSVTANTTTAINISMSAGTPAADAEIDIQRPASASIADGGTDNTGSNASGPVSLTYTIDNTAGNNHLLLASPTASGLVNVSGFTVTAQPPVYIAGGNTGTFTVQFTVDSPGAFSLDMVLNNGDADENPYNITVTGTGGPIPVGGRVYPADKLPVAASLLGVVLLAVLAAGAGASRIGKPMAE